MAWLQLRLDTSPGQVERLEELLMATGAVAVTLEDNADQPVLEPGVGETPLWGQTRLTGLYPADTDMATVLQAFPEDDLVAASHRIEILEDRDWEREWMQHYQPMRFGRRLWVCPSWLAPPDPDAINLLLDPGLAFGTGTHPTTALCLGALDAMNLSGVTAVDYGCGSGILATAALKLGARQVLAVDNDPQALVATRENAARNSISRGALEIAAPESVDWPGWAHRADIGLRLETFSQGGGRPDDERRLVVQEVGDLSTHSGLEVIDAQGTALPLSAVVLEAVLTRQELHTLLARSVPS